MIKLNQEQKTAVEYAGKGPLLIIAGAGTGKTTVITERISWLIAQQLAKPEEILALTFTDKAAREMEERVDIKLPYGYTQMWIATFHAFCDRILKNEAIHIGLNPAYHLLTKTEGLSFLRQELFNLELEYFRPLGNPNKFIFGLLQHFSRLKDEDISPTEYAAWVDKIKAKDVVGKEELSKFQELAKAYQAFENLKVKRGYMDFGDLISNTLSLFRKRASILAEYRQRFKYILVDEFQDTNIAQYELIKLLAEPQEKPNLTVVGDDSQSIYKFRGAAVSNILSFMKDYQGARRVVLLQNYRSGQEILDAAYRLIKNNDPDTLESRLGINKNLMAERQIQSHVAFIREERVEDEAETVARTIKKIAVADKRSWQDFAILVRANNHVDPFIRALQRAGIPYQFLGPGMLFKQPEVKDLIAYLKVLHNFEDDISFYRVLSMSLFNLPVRELTGLSLFARRHNFSLFEACEQIFAESGQKANIRLPYLTAETKNKLAVIFKMINRHLKLAVKETAGQVLYFFLEDAGLLKKLSQVKTENQEKQAQNISRFFDKLKAYEVEHEEASVAAVVDWLELSLELGESPTASNSDWVENNAVNILTVHSSKGLEFPVVFLVNLTIGRFPTYERSESVPIPDELIKEILPEGDFHLEEERRLFYVGMTRARDALFLSAANYYGEGKRERKISPFVMEALGEEMVKKATKSANGETGQLSFLDWQKPVVEKDRPPQRALINYLSYSQIQTYDLCPLKYKYRYVLKIPTVASAAASLGQSVHETLRYFYDRVKKGEKPTAALLMELLDQYWLPLGYNSKVHEEKAKAEARQMLTIFLKKGFDPKVLPEETEQIFTIKVTADLKIGGKIDRIDRANGAMEIIDYKTGKVPPQKEIDKSLQMTVYALAVTDEGLWQQDINNLTLSFYFLKTGEKLSTKRDRDDLEKARQELRQKRDEMATSEFLPRKGNHCDFCEFKFLCPAWEN